MSRPLTAELIRVRTKTDNLTFVKKFTLCGNDIDEVKILRQMPNIEVLSLSVNSINSLREFANCRKLQELYVRGNKIGNLAEVQYLQNLPDLRVLWLCENPCANNEYYREYVINVLPQLTTLDKVSISQEERAAAARTNFDIPEQNSNPPSDRNSYNPGGYEENTPRNSEKRNQQSPYDQYYAPSHQQQDVNEFSPYERERERERDRDVPSSRGSNRGYQPAYSPPKEYKRNAPQAYSRGNVPTLKNENVISAILMLLKDLDDNGLRVVKQDVERRLIEPDQP